MRFESSPCPRASLSRKTFQLVARDDAETVGRSELSQHVMHVVFHCLPERFNFAAISFLVRRSRSGATSSCSLRLTAGLPLRGAEQGSAVEGDLADLDHAHQTYKLTLGYFVAFEQLGIIAEVAQEPVQLSQRFRVAIHARGKNLSGKPVWGSRMAKVSV